MRNVWPCCLAVLSGRTMKETVDASDGNRKRHAVSFICETRVCHVQNGVYGVFQAEAKRGGIGAVD